ncbi:MAG: CAP family protein [Nitrososphaeraceae archaeon]
MYNKASIKIIVIIIVAVVGAAILTVSSSVLQISHAQTNADLQNTILDVHNRERDLVGVMPLTWNKDLAAGAQAWAQVIATTGKFVHDPVNAVPLGPYGENIAGFFTGVSEPNEGQSRWVNEKSNYVKGQQWQPGMPVTGHYTQMVWRNTKEIGCGTAPPGAGGLPYSILVCRYNPPGNYPGQNPY